jgi:uncharacterized protein YndB with AHSA1/START domain
MFEVGRVHPHRKPPIGGASIDGMTGIEAKAELDIAATPERIWSVLTDNDAFGEVMFGSEVVTDWQVGSPILFRGTWEGKPFEDKGEILELDPPRRMRVTHFSPLTGEEDRPENYHEVRYDLTPAADGTRVTVTQDNNATPEAADHSTANWTTMLESLKKVAER